MSEFGDAVNQSARQYISWDPNSGTRSIIESKLSTIQGNELKDLGSLVDSKNRLKFGTAGLRGAMGAGYNCMNDLVVLQTSQGLLKYICDSIGSEDGYSNSQQTKIAGIKAQGIVVGYDHRKQGSLLSKGFARITAAVFLQQGFKVYLLENFVPTPFVAFAVKELNCVAGVMVTASHNPMQDNGYKLYWGNGAQIISPHDVNIARYILENLEPWEQYSYSDEAVQAHPLAQDVTESIAAQYYAAIAKLNDYNTENARSHIQFVYTAMHGVGWQWVERAFTAFGFSPSTLRPVATQCQPDPTFPTVRFPNPEEKGALDESIKFADQLGSVSLIIANDPDADRLAAAEKLPDGSGWRVFTGNELGVLLGHWQIQRWKKKKGQEKAQGQGEKDAAVLASIVSSRMLRAIAAKEAVKYYDTLTGFKWLGNRSIQLREEGVEVLFAYEEALGYCAGDIVCDKDGVSAAAVFAEMAVALTEEGKTIQAQLLYLNRTYGEFFSYNSYVISRQATVTAAIFKRLRKGGPSGGYWTSCAGVDIVNIKDITAGYDSTNPPGQGSYCFERYESSLPRTNDDMIMFEFSNTVSVTLRTSGTEPKIKFYTELCWLGTEPGADTSSAPSPRDILVSFVNALVQEMLQPQENGLEIP